MYEYITTKEAAAVIGVKQATINAYCQAGVLPSTPMNGRKILVPRESAEHVLHLKQTQGRYWMKSIGVDYWTERAARRIHPGVETLEERDWTPEPIETCPPVRDIYRHDPVHQDNGVRCVDCGGRVLDTPAYCRGVQWRCTRCRKAQERPLPSPLEPMALRAGHSPLVNAVVAHLQAFGPSTTTDLVHATHTERKALVKSLEASTRVGYEHKSKTWRLREVKA